MWNKPKNSNFFLFIISFSPSLFSSSISFHAAEMYLLYLPIVHEKMFVWEWIKKSFDIYAHTVMIASLDCASAVTFFCPLEKQGCDTSKVFNAVRKSFHFKKGMLLAWDKNFLIPSYLALAQSTLVAMPINLSHTISRTHRHTHTHYN